MAIKRYTAIADNTITNQFDEALSRRRLVQTLVWQIR